jgi:DNA-binding MarR family transcriptional regulator
VRENRQDKVGHGTHLIGADAWNAKLTAEQVAYIRKLALTMSQSDIAREMGLTRNIVSKVVRRESYKDVP